MDRLYTMDACAVADALAAIREEDERATDLWLAEIDELLMASRLFPGDFIAGTMIVCGFNPNVGVNVELPADWLAAAMKALPMWKTPA